MHYSTGTADNHETHKNVLPQVTSLLVLLSAFVPKRNSKMVERSYERCSATSRWNKFQKVLKNPRSSGISFLIKGWFVTLSVIISKKRFKVLSQTFEERTSYSNRPQQAFYTNKSQLLKPSLHQSSQKSSVICLARFFFAKKCIFTKWQQKNTFKLSIFKTIHPNATALDESREGQQTSAIRFISWWSKWTDNLQARPGHSRDSTSTLCSCLCFIFDEGS